MPTTYKDKYHNNEVFRQYDIERHRVKYETNPEYREMTKRRALERYYRLKAERKANEPQPTTD